MPYKVKHTKVKKYKAFCFCVVIVQRTYVFIFGSHTKLYIFVKNIKLIEGETRKCIAFLPNIALGYYHQNLQCYRNAQRYLQQCPLTRFIILHTSRVACDIFSHKTHVDEKRMNCVYIVKYACYAVW